MTDAAIDLSRLPAPTVVEAIDYEMVLAALKADLVARWPDYTADLESDPAIKLLEVAAYREVLLRQRVNDAARAVLVRTALAAVLKGSAPARRSVATKVSPAVRWAR